MPPIFLIGYMGSGKTTLGRAMSIATGLPFIDLDQWIEEHQGCPVSTIWQRHGEQTFRRLEREALERLSKRCDVIVACGGGTPCFFDNMDLMQSRGVTVWLDASRPRLLSRLREAQQQRPLIAAISSDSELDAYIASGLEHRHPHYSRAAVRFPADHLDSPDELARSVREFIALLGLHTKQSSQP